jgi:glycosyltransferase involved in cell wall biosynthesis
VATYHGVPDAAAGRWVTGGPLAGRRLSAAGAATLAADAAVARSTRVTVAPSETMGRFLTTQLRVPAGRVRVIRNGVRLPPPHVPQPRAERFVSVGSFAALKQMPALIDAFARVAAGRPGLELWLVGDGDERARGHDLVHALGLAEQVRFLGYRDDVPAQLAACDAFVLPSINENLPLALLEAMGAGLACVATDVGGIAEALTAGAGLLVRPGDGDGLVAAMARLADEDGLARQLGARAAAVAREQFSIERCADEHVALWSELAG